MALRQQNSAASKVMRTAYFENGKPFTTQEMADELGLPNGMVRAALMALKDTCAIATDGNGLYWRRLIHPINQRTLTDPRPLELACAPP